MAAKTRLGSGGYGVRRAGSFAGRSPAAAGRLKYWTGSAWTAKTLKYWDGASWTTKTLKYWNGSAWTS